LPLNPTSEYYDTRLAAKYTYDLHQFREHLTNRNDYRVPATLLVCSSSSQRVAAAEKIAATLNGCGFMFTVAALPQEAYETALKNGEFDLYYGQIRLSPNFDLAEFFTPGGSACFGGIADSAAQTLCRYTLENRGNSYDLYRQILDRGLLCPVLLKINAIYTTRGIIPALYPAADSVLYDVPPNTATPS